MTIKKRKNIYINLCSKQSQRKKYTKIFDFKPKINKKSSNIIKQKVIKTEPIKKYK